MPDRGHHSIGEVLSLLKEDFPDVTISKIRFLESQGLIDPERTPSGYRKFYEPDIEQLRWILTQQRDNFLPLKVIRRRLADAGYNAVSRAERNVGPAPEPALFSQRRVDETARASTPAQPGEPDENDVEGATPPTESVLSTNSVTAPDSSVSLTADELATASGLDAALLTDLVRLGLIEPNDIDGQAVYDHHALVVAKAASGFAARGLEARHLRMFKVAAEREAGVLEQLLRPRVRSGDASSQVRMREELAELVALGETIHRALLHRSLGSELD